MRFLLVSVPRIFFRNVNRTQSDRLEPPVNKRSLVSKVPRSPRDFYAHGQRTERRTPGRPVPKVVRIPPPHFFVVHAAPQRVFRCYSMKGMWRDSARSATCGYALIRRLVGGLRNIMLNLLVRSKLVTLIEFRGFS